MGDVPRGAALRHACERLSDEDLDAAMQHARAGGRFENAVALLAAARPAPKRKARKPTRFGGLR